MGRIFPSDWLDVVLHLVVAAVATALVAWLIDYRLALVLNTIGWPLREWLQNDYWIGGTRRTALRDWSVQKHWEAWPPVLLGWLVVAEVMARG